MTKKTRPASFDARVMAYLPGLKNLSRKYYKHDPIARNDLVTDTICAALSGWENYREDGGMWCWLAWTMRGARSSLRRGRKIQMVDAPVQYLNASTDPSQEAYTDLMRVLRHVPNDRGGDILMRRVMGDTLVEIGAPMGISGERIRQIEQGTRAVVISRSERRRNVA